MKQNFNTIANNIKLFGWMFSNIHIRRKNSTTNEKQDIYVPITYIGKERMFFLMNKSQTDLGSAKIDAVYPKMGYELIDMFPDWERMTNPYQLISNSTFDEHGEPGVEVELNKIPFNFKFRLTIAVIHQTDLFHILEQIFTFFRPSYTMKANLNPLLGENKSDVTIVLTNGVFKDFNEEGPFSDNPEKPIVYTIEFDQKSWIWTANDEDDGGGEPGGFGKPIKEIELGIWVQKEPFTEEQIKDDNMYYIHIPEHIESTSGDLGDDEPNNDDGAGDDTNEPESTTQG